ncbi:hypothetical protein W803_00760, partial [Staphylococcus aureus VET1822S]
GSRTFLMKKAIVNQGVEGRNEKSLSL